MRTANRLAQLVLTLTLASLCVGPKPTAADDGLKWSPSVADHFLGPYVMLVPTSPRGQLVLIIAPNDGIFPTKLPAQASAETATFELTVSREGAVERATRTSSLSERKGYLPIYDSIPTALRTWRFRPLIGTETSFPVTIRDVRVVIAYAPALTDQKIRYPNAATANDIRVQLKNISGGERGGGTAVKFEVGNDGIVTYAGTGYAAITGDHRGQISPAAARGLFAALTSIDPLQAAAKGARKRFHGYDTDVITISQGTRDIFVGWQLRLDNPPRLNELDLMAQAIRDAIDTERWTKGNASTIPSLRAEGWNFRSDKTPNTDFAYGAAVMRNEQLVKDLIALGVPVPASLKRAATGCNKDAVLLMLRHSPRLEPATLTQAMLSIVRCNAFDVVRALVAAGANPKGVDEHGKTLLMYATISGDPRFVEYALNQGVDVDATMVDGRKAIHSVRNEATLKLLLDAGADINARDDHGRTPLMQAVNSEELVSLLIKFGADVNAVDKFGYTALTRNGPCPSYRVSRILKDAGATPDKSGRCPWSD